MAEKITFSGLHNSLDDVQEYYIDSEKALESYFSFSELTGISARFIGYSEKEVYEELISRKDYLDKLCSLELLTVLEARFQLDYLVGLNR
ncbi:MAG: hypothetical protein GY862_34315 [Gammaproteobacteria bacterium]|nr:hypothetical protein [Gammaproteobacteria bacterium]